MKRRIDRTRGLAVLLGVVSVSAAAVLPALPFRPESRLWVEGTSTVRSFTCEAERLDGSVNALPEASRFSLGGLQAAVRGVEVKVPVESLECGNGTMNSHLFKALKGEQHPEIGFRLTDHHVAPGEAGEAAVKLTGRLRMAGQERPVELEGRATVAADGTLRFRGSEEIVMSEFGIKPPSLMMGTMKVGDRVRVHFDVALRP